ncbi:MAG: AraC family transcriptional regulator [Planctomycetota bacterium]
MDDFFAQNPDIHHVLSLFEYLPNVSFYAKDTRSRFVRVNERFVQTHGCQHEHDVLGKSDRDFHPPVLAEAYIAEDQRVMAGGVAIPNQVWLVPNARGTPQWYMSSKTPLFSAQGGLIGIAGAMYLIDRPDEQARVFGEVLPAVRHMDAHFCEPISMPDVAALAGLSIAHFNRRFKALLRMTPGEYLIALRTQESQRLLVQTSLSIAEVAARTGFYDQSHLTKRFRRETGLTPLAYRKRFR